MTGKCYYCNQPARRRCKKCRHNICGSANCPGSPCPGGDEAKERIVRGLERVRDEAEQIARDAKAWNDLNSGEVPFDTGGEIVTARLAQDCIDVVRASDGKIPDKPFKKLVAHCKRNRT